MFLTTHAAIGAIGAQYAPNPLWGFVIGFVSHFIIDMIPHGDAHLYEGYKSRAKVRKAIAYVSMDAVAGIILVSWLFTSVPINNPTIVLFGVLGGVLPDLLVGLYEIVRHKWLKSFCNFHFFFHNFFVHRKRDVRLRHGIIMQIAFLAFLITKIV